MELRLELMSVVRADFPDPEREFFDCVEDPLELINCYGDSRYSDEVSRMRALLDAKMSEIGDVPRH